MGKASIAKRRFEHVFTTIVFSFFLIACTPQAGLLAATPTPGPIRPGDTVKGVRVTTGGTESSMLFDLPCTKEADGWRCTAICGEPLNPLVAIANKDAAQVPVVWETLIYTATIEGRQVDLEAFGTYDFVHPQNEMNMRAYNLALQCSEPVTLTLVDEGGLPNQPFNDRTVIVFEAAPQVDAVQPLSSAPGQPGQHAYRSEKTGFELLLYLPGEYGKDAQQTWPLILFLHGGPNITSLDWVRSEPIAVQLDGQVEFPFIVASPLQTGKYEYWSQAEVMNRLLALVQELERLFAIDPGQIYLAGFIEGASGVWNLAIAHPELFAAIVPAGGYSGYPFSVPEDICALKDMPVWAFHGKDDADVPVSAQQMLVDALKACGNEQVQLTILPGHNGEMMFTAFADAELYEWMRRQGR